ncbi:unnamed protein product [Allacma fusca]|uniref:Uncharacterized protein n=1 Tax=Allacma fusca TaxID=39272 RepID=A0A8J2IYS8_9HEXA|nr:unnamed protein product [Allacma fusca]
MFIGMATHLLKIKYYLPRPTFSWSRRAIISRTTAGRETGKDTTRSSFNYTISHHHHPPNPCVYEWIRVCSFSNHQHN